MTADVIDLPCWRVRHYLIGAVERGEILRTEITLDNGTKRYAYELPVAKREEPGK